MTFGNSWVTYKFNSKSGKSIYPCKDLNIASPTTGEEVRSKLHEMGYDAVV
jgi:hypothetical protein